MGKSTVYHKSDFVYFVSFLGCFRLDHHKYSEGRNCYETETLNEDRIQKIKYLSNNGK